MKKFIKIHYLLILNLLLSGCETDLDINKNPDLLVPNKIPLSSELPAAITGIAGATGSYYAIIGGFWSQFWTQSAVANQYKSIDDYTLNAGSSINSGGWANMYDALTDVRNIKRVALEEENWNYYLIATTLEVYASQVLTDFYGEIPYSEANDAGILNPKFESEETVYDLMVSNLKEALGKDLSTSPKGNQPGDTDFIFKGDMTKWVQFANTVLLKVYLRQTEVRESVAQSGINELYTNNASFLEEDAVVDIFIDGDSKSNPLYESDRRQLNVGTNLRASSTMGSYLSTNDDPRLAKFFDGTTFQNQGDYDDGSGSAAVVKLSATDPVYFISLAESKFLQAEAAVRFRNGTNASALYDAGVIAAFSQWGLEAGDLITGAYVFPNTNDNDQIEAIITQKWISFFPGKGYESFFEYNRTGFPITSSINQTDPEYIPGQFVYSIEGKTGGVFPKRIEYPIDESQRNSNTPVVKKITEPVWYDAN